MAGESPISFRRIVSDHTPPQLGLSKYGFIFLYFVFFLQISNLEIPFYWIPILPGENSKAFWKYPKGESHFRKTKVSEHFEHSSTGNARRVQLLLFRKFWLFLGFATEHKEAGIQKILILLNFDPDCSDIWGFGFFAPARVTQRTEGKNEHFISLFSWLLRIRNSGK